MTINQNSSLIQMHNSPIVGRYQALLSLPTKNPGGVVNLDYIQQNSELLKNQFVDVVVAVTFVSVFFFFKKNILKKIYFICVYFNHFR